MTSKKIDGSAVVVDEGDMTDKDIAEAAGVDVSDIVAVKPVVFTVEQKSALATLLRAVHKLSDSAESEHLGGISKITERDMQVAKMVAAAVAAVPWAMAIKLNPQMEEFELSTAWQLAAMLTEELYEEFAPKKDEKYN
jgi:hypothetical protein